MWITTHRIGRTARVAVAGGVDRETSPLLLRALLRALRGSAARVLVDLGQVTSLETSGLATLVTARDAARRRGVDFRLSRPGEHALRLLRLFGLEEMFPPEREPLPPPPPRPAGVPREGRGRVGAGKVTNDSRLRM